MARNNKLITAANFKDFDWNKAKLFYHIAKCGSFTKAARLAGTDRTSLNRQIQLLEEQIGSNLLVRKTGVGSIMLTRKGQELLEKVAPFFLDMKGFCGNHHVEIKGEKKRKIKISTTHALAAYIISDIILDYSKRNPSVSFEIIADDYLMDIIINDADIGIHPIDTKAFNKQIEYIQYDHLFSVEKKLFASEEYIRTYGEPRLIDDLKDHYIIAYNQPEIGNNININWILTLGMSEGKYHNPIYTSNSIESLINAAKRGVGIIGSYEEFSIIKESNLIKILPDVKDKPQEAFFIYPRYLNDDKIILNIRDYLKEKLNP